MELKEVFNKALSYQAYRKHVDQLIGEGKTTGNDQSDNLIEFTKLNIQRMNRNDKTVVIPDELKAQLSQIREPSNWLLIGDAWCGDCAQTIPVINKLAEACGKKADFRIISRDAFPGFIEKYSPNGSKGIPLLIVFDHHEQVQFIWGSRPEPAHEILLHWKANQDKITKNDFEKELHLWYGRDRGKVTITEISQRLLQPHIQTA